MSRGVEVRDVLGVDARDFLGVEVRHVLGVDVRDIDLLGVWGAVCAKIRIDSVNLNR